MIIVIDSDSDSDSDSDDAVMMINSMFARLGTDYEIRNQWFFAIMEAMTTD